MSVRVAALVSSLLLLLSAGGLLAPSAGAQARVEEKVSFGITGELAAVDAAARTIKVKGEHDEGLVYGVDGSATVLAGSEARSLGDLAVGSSVVMNGHGEGSRRVVTYIKVVKAP